MPLTAARGTVQIGQQDNSSAYQRSGRSSPGLPGLLLAPMLPGTAASSSIDRTPDHTQACRAGTEARNKPRQETHNISASLADQRWERCWHQLAGLRRLPSWRPAQPRTRRAGPASTWSSWSSAPSSAVLLCVVPVNPRLCTESSSPCSPSSGPVLVLTRAHDGPPAPLPTPPQPGL